VISPKIAKLIQYLPDVLVNFGVKVVINNLIKKYADLDIRGEENLIGLKKPVIFICNHLSNSDGLILNKVLKDQDVTYVAGVKLTENATTNFGIRIMKTTSVKPNSADKEGLTKVINILKGGNNILIFPEGGRSRTGSMIEAKKGILLIARVTKTPIVPIGIWGTEKFMPINQEGDMAGESFHHAKIGLRIGKPMELPDKEQGEDKRAYEERSLTSLMKAIAQLIPEEYRGIYK
jgi:1-acyl-sn-glycerol-3-phosphate acyltransferase